MTNQEQITKAYKDGQANGIKRMKDKIAKLEAKLQKVREWAEEEEKYPFPNDLLRETKATIIQGRTQAKEELKKIL